MIYDICYMTMVCDNDIYVMIWYYVIDMIMYVMIKLVVKHMLWYEHVVMMEYMLWYDIMLYMIMLWYMFNISFCMKHMYDDHYVMIYGIYVMIWY